MEGFSYNRCMSKIKVRRLAQNHTFPVESRLNLNVNDGDIHIRRNYCEFYNMKGRAMRYNSVKILYSVAYYIDYNKRFENSLKIFSTK